MNKNYQKIPIKYTLMSLVGLILVSLYIFYLSVSKKKLPIIETSNVYLSCIDNSIQKENPSLIVLIDSLEALNIDSMSQLNGARSLKLSLGRHLVKISTKSENLSISDTIHIMDSLLNYRFCVVYNGISNGYDSSAFSIIFHDLLKE